MDLVTRLDKADFSEQVKFSLAVDQIGLPRYTRLSEIFFNSEHSASNPYYYLLFFRESVGISLGKVFFELRYRGYVLKRKTLPC